MLWSFFVDLIRPNLLKFLVFNNKLPVANIQYQKVNLALLRQNHYINSCSHFIAVSDSIILLNRQICELLADHRQSRILAIVPSCQNHGAKFFVLVVTSSCIYQASLQEGWRSAIHVPITCPQEWLQWALVVTPRVDPALMWEYLQQIDDSFSHAIEWENSCSRKVGTDAREWRFDLPKTAEGHFKLWPINQLLEPRDIFVLSIQAFHAVWANLV